MSLLLEEALLAQFNPSSASNESVRHGGTIEINLMSDICEGAAQRFERQSTPPE